MRLFPMTNDAVPAKSIRRGRVRWLETVIQGVLGCCALISIMTTATIVFVLASESLGFFQTVSPGEFFLGTSWVPMFEPSSFGVLPLLWGTAIVTLGAALFAIPIGLASALYLSEYASPGKRAVIKPLLGIISRYTYRGVRLFRPTFITPALRTLFPRYPGVQRS